jgi:hypothetical protein
MTDPVSTVPLPMIVYPLCGDEKAYILYIAFKEIQDYFDRLKSCGSL